MAILLLVRTFELDPKQKHNFNLDKVDIEDLRIHPIFVDYVKSFQPLLLNVFKYTNRATIMSKYLQQMGGKLMRYTKVSYKSSYWKVFEQALIDVVSGGNAGDETIEALTILANFCSEQMRIGFRIEYKLQEAALRMVALQERKKVKKNK
uniref:DRIM domain-containing protein n=1 Tax=Rhabditophanes sp. KR3021 TaxID=114890 RepID=A0AC35TVF3_9BILA